MPSEYDKVLKQHREPIDEFAMRWHDVEADGEFQQHPAVVFRGDPVDEAPETRDVEEMC